MTDFEEFLDFEHPEAGLGGLGGGGGNTQNPSPSSKKQVPKRKGHFFTWNNYKMEDVEEMLKIWRREGVIKYAFQEEIAPETGTPHLQGMCVFSNEKRDTTWDPHGKAHWEKLKKFDGVYQLKEKSRKPNGIQWVFGFPKPIKLIQTLRPWQEIVWNICKEEPDDRCINWFWEPTGKVGKSVFVKWLVVKHKALPCIGGKFGDIMNLVFNQNMDETNIVVFDIPRSHEGHVSYASLEAIKNGLVCNTKYETGYKVFNPPHIICFANFPPDDPEQLSNDKWNIKEIHNNILI